MNVHSFALPTGDVVGLGRLKWPAEEGRLSGFRGLWRYPDGNNRRNRCRGL